jgi:hypothetical protein
MKIKRMRSINFYKIYNCCNAHEVYVDFKPSKKDIIEIFNLFEWEKEEDGTINNGNIEITKISVYEKRN